MDLKIITTLNALRDNKFYLTRTSLGVLYVLFLFCLMCINVTYAQDAEIETQFKKPTPEEEIKLKKILDEPLNTDAPTTTLEKQINDKRLAARQLGKRDLVEIFLKEALPFIKTPAIRNEIAIIFRERGEFEKAISMHKEAFEIANPPLKPFFLAHIANDYLHWGKLP